MFGSWKSPAPFTRVNRDWAKIETVNRSIETPDKANAMFLAISPRFPSVTTIPITPRFLSPTQCWAAAKANRAFQGAFAVKTGLSYQRGQPISASAPRKNSRSGLSFANCNPQNILKVEADFKDEMAKMLEQGFSPEELAAAKKTYAQDQQVARSSDRNLAAILAQNAQYDRTMAREAAIDQKSPP